MDAAHTFGNVCSAYTAIIAPNETFDKRYNSISQKSA